MKRLFVILFSALLGPGLIYAEPSPAPYAVTELQTVVYWSKGKEPLKDYRLLLDDFANQLKDNGELMLEIKGHADPEREKKKAKKLSEERARWAKDYIVSKGIDASRITIAGLGGSEPVYSGKEKREQAKNRRVEVAIVNKSEVQ